jgi:hypothetical protein
MAGIQLATNAQGLNPFDVDSVTVIRYADTNVVGVISTTDTTIWSGLADFQEGSGEVYYNPSGAVEEIDATLIIDTQPLPAVLVGDVVTGNSRTYSVIAVTTSTFALSFLRLMLKRGPIADKQK